ncbi:putative membrane protein [Vibrio cholerae]|nr:putative membrane protein [Vibrio cholerae]GIB16723.1 putative membrane protein [Vibrio cholerae]
MEHVEMVQPSALGVVGRTLMFSLLALGFTFMLL